MHRRVSIWVSRVWLGIIALLLSSSTVGITKTRPYIHFVRARNNNYSGGRAGGRLGGRAAGRKQTGRNKKKVGTSVNEKERERERERESERGDSCVVLKHSCVVLNILSVSI